MRPWTPVLPGGLLAPGPDRDQVLRLVPRPARAAAVALVEEGVERSLELGLAAVLARVRLGRDGRPVAPLEVLGEVVGTLERRDVEQMALDRRELHAVAQQLAHV